MTKKRETKAEAKPQAAKGKAKRATPTPESPVKPKQPEKPTKKGTPRVAPRAAPRSPPPPFEVDENSPPELLFQAGRQRLPSWQDKAPRKAQRRAEAIALLRRAAEAGHEAALDLVAGVDSERGFEWAVIAAKRGEPRHLTSRMTMEEHAADGLAVLEAARAGEPWAMFAVGLVYGMGMEDTETGELVATRDGAWGWLPGVADPEAESVRWIARAADAGSAEAALALATDLHRADDPHAALHRARQAAAGSLSPKRRARAAALIARLLDELEAPMAERLALYEQLAEAGDDDALVWLGERYRDGDGVARDVTRARALFERAAALASVDGLRELGRMCEAGIGGPADELRARECYEQAAELGADPFSRDRLATRFGLTWYARAADE